jgi:hypothetical protein
MLALDGLAQVLLHLHPYHLVPIKVTAMYAAVMLPATDLYLAWRRTEWKVAHCHWRLIRFLTSDNRG